MNKKYLLYILIVLFLVPKISLAAGADKIFFEIGQDKPSQWNNWSREERHDYLKSLGIYPDETGHYSGNTGNLTTYFEMLGKQMPNNWDSMTFAEKKEFVNNTNNETTSQKIEEKQLTSNTAKAETYKMPHIYIVLIGFIVGFIMMRVAYKTD